MPNVIEMYNLSKHPREVHDMVEQDLERLERMIKMWDQYVLETGVISLELAMGQRMAGMEEQMPEDASIGYRDWEAVARDDLEALRKEVARFERSHKVVWRDGRRWKFAKLRLFKSD